MTKQSELYYQCELSSVEVPNLKTVGWIEERGAHIGLLVELVLEHPMNKWWQVDAVYGPAISKEELTEQQKLNRGSLASIT